MCYKAYCRFFFSLFPKTRTHRSSVSASSTWSSDSGYEAAKAVDGDEGTRWASNDSVTTATFTVLFEETYMLNYMQINQCMSRITRLEIQRLKKDGDPDRDADWVTFTTCGQWGQDTMQYYLVFRSNNSRSSERK